MGSDLDLLLVDASADGPQQQRLVRWPLEKLPLSCDALVLTPMELEELLASGSRMALELQRDLRWLPMDGLIGCAGYQGPVVPLEQVDLALYSNRPLPG